MANESNPENPGHTSGSTGPAERSQKKAAGDPTIEVDRSSVRLAVVAHELNNLLSGAIRSMGLAQRDIDAVGEARCAADTSTQHQLDMVRASLGKMAHIVDGVMRSSDQSYSRELSEPRPMVDALSHARSTMTPLALQQEIQVELDVSQHMVLAPAGPIFTIVTCCLRNAIEATPVGGVVTLHADLVSTGEGVAEVQIDILDEGPGPPPADGDDLFAFGMSTRPGKLGVGLALCREIVEELGGTIELLQREATSGRKSGGAHLRIRYRIPCPATG